MKKKLQIRFPKLISTTVIGAEMNWNAIIKIKNLGIQKHYIYIRYLN